MTLEFDFNNKTMVKKYNAWLAHVLDTYETGKGRDDEDESAWSRQERVTLRTWLNGFIHAEGLLAWATRLNWSEEDVLGYNNFARQMGSGGPWRSEISILKAYSSDAVIFKALLMAHQVQDRVVDGGECLSQDELKPKGFIPLHGDLDDEPVEAAAEDGVVMENTDREEVERENVIDELDDHDFGFK